MLKLHFYDTVLSHVSAPIYKVSYSYTKKLFRASNHLGLVSHLLWYLQVINKSFSIAARCEVDTCFEKYNFGHVQMSSVRAGTI